MNVNVPLPSIIIGTHDYCHLVRAAGVSGPEREREFLRTELRRAVIAHPHDVPADAIAIIPMKATRRPAPAMQEVQNPWRVALDTESRLFGPGAMFSAKHAGTKTRRVS